MSAPIGYTLPESAQFRNGLVFMTAMSLIYLIAPVTYVGVLHATILDSLEASDTVANLPESVYLWVTPLPLLIAWFWPSPHLLRPMLTWALIVSGGAGALAALVFAFAPESFWIPVMIIHPGIIGITGGVQTMCLWELIGRGMTPEMRGRTLGWTFGIGPIFAVLGSCASQLMLKGDFLGMLKVTPISPPWSYVLLFGVSCPAMWLSAVLVQIVQVPPVSESECESESAAQWKVILRGMRSYFLNPLIVITASGFLLTYGGTMIMNNMSLYARETLGEAPEKYAGIQLALRFGFKCLMGFGLGWLVTRMHARASLMATTSICIAGIAWALFVPGKWYLLGFGLLGGGELFYVYYMNYIVSCSQPERMRENTAYTNLITVTIGMMPIVFGLVSDRFGLRASFVAAIALLVLALILVQSRLPKQPTIADATSA
jgi:MFS family permease